MRGWFNNPPSPVFLLLRRRAHASDCSSAVSVSPSSKGTCAIQQNGSISFAVLRSCFAWRPQGTPVCMHAVYVWKRRIRFGILQLRTWRFHSTLMIMITGVQAHQSQKWIVKPVQDWSWSLQLTFNDARRCEERARRGETLLLHGRRSPITLCPSTLTARLWISWPEKDQGTNMSDWVNVNLVSCLVVGGTSWPPALVSCMWTRDRADNFFTDPNSPYMVSKGGTDAVGQKASIFHWWCTRSFGQEWLIVSIPCLHFHRQGMIAAIWMSDSKRWSNLKRKQRLHPQAETSGCVSSAGRVLIHHLIKIDPGIVAMQPTRLQLAHFTTTLQPLLRKKQCPKRFCAHIPPHHPAVTPRQLNTNITLKIHN